MLSKGFEVTIYAWKFGFMITMLIILREKRLLKTLLTFIAPNINVDDDDDVDNNDNDKYSIMLNKPLPLRDFPGIERFLYDLEMKTREQNRNKRTKIERFDWFIERIQTRVAFGWLSERSGEKTSCPRTF